MKRRFLVLDVWLLSNLLLPAQTFHVIHNFTGSSSPYANGQLLLTSNTLYGTTMGGGSSGYGTVFKISTDGKDYAAIKNFTAIDADTSTNTDGAGPMAGLVMHSHRLFGTTCVGGSGGKGTVFGLDTNGANFVGLNNFSGTNGRNPVGLTLSSNVLYGTAAAGGTSNKGAIFRVNPDGTGFAVLKHFSPVTGTSGANYLNADGMYPLGDLMAADGVLYGTTQYGGLHGCGTIYSLTIPPPPLQITNVAGHPLVFWSDDGLNRTLRRTTDIATGSWTNVISSNWTNPASTPQQIGYQIADTHNSTSAFFRLQ